MRKILYSVSILLVVVVVLPGCFSSQETASRDRYYAPDWAPAYESGVRYYYIPDIETYYDVVNKQYIYLDRGHWVSSLDLPPVYRGYDLYNGYSVMLDRRVYEPWRYHQNYVSSYPRYYYREVYGNQNAGSIRGYNENARKPVYDRSRRSTTPPSQVPEVNSGTSRERQPSDYSNRRVGKPVKVTPEMRQPGESSPSSVTNRRQSSSTSTGTGTGTGSSGEIEQQKRSSTTAPPSERARERRQQQDANTDTKKSSEENRPSNRRR